MLRRGDNRVGTGSVGYTIITTNPASVLHMWQWTRQCAMGGAVAGLDGFEKQFRINMIVGQSTWKRKNDVCSPHLFSFLSLLLA